MWLGRQKGTSEPSLTPLEDYPELYHGYGVVQSTWAGASC